MSTVHVLPVADLIDHVDSGDDCPCGPTTEPVEAEDGYIGWLVTHHSLDGREAHEGLRARVFPVAAALHQAPSRMSWPASQLSSGVPV